MSGWRRPVWWLYTNTEETGGDDREASGVLLCGSQLLCVEGSVENLQEELQRVLIQEMNLHRDTTQNSHNWVDHACFVFFQVNYRLLEGKRLLAFMRFNAHTYFHEWKEGSCTHKNSPCQVWAEKQKETNITVCYLLQSLQSEIDAAAALGKRHVLLWSGLHFCHHYICLLHLLGNLRCLVFQGFQVSQDATQSQHHCQHLVTSQMMKKNNHQSYLSLWFFGLFYMD